MVEFALTAILLMTVVFFIIEFGQAIWRYNTVASIAKDAVRYAAVHGSASGSPVDSAAIQTYVDGRSNGITLVARTSWPDAGSNLAGKRVQVRVEGSYIPQTRLIPTRRLNLISTAQVVIAR